MANKFTAFAPVCHPYLNSQTFASFLCESQQWKFEKSFQENQDFGKKPKKSYAWNYCRARKTSRSRYGPLSKLSIWHVHFVGFKSILKRAGNLWCAQHLEKNDSKQLRYHSSNDKDRRKSMADIYGSQNEVLLQERLADAINDFKAKLHCVKSVQIRSIFWSVFSRIRTEYGKIRTRKYSVFGHFSRSAGQLETCMGSHSISIPLLIPRQLFRNFHPMPCLGCQGKT